MSAEKTFDAERIAAELKLHMIPPERLIALAQDAMEAGFDGPGIVRMAILQPDERWEIGKAEEGMRKELGSDRMTLRDAAFLLAERRVRQLLGSGENPAMSIPYFNQIYTAVWNVEGVDPIPGLERLAYMDDDFYILGEKEEEEFRAIAQEALEEFLDAELREKREREAQYEFWRTAGQFNFVLEKDWSSVDVTDWPYAFDSPTRRELLRERLREKMEQWPQILGVLCLSWLAAVWGFGWLWPSVGLLGYLPLLALHGYWAEYRRLKRERRDILLRMRYPEDRI